MVGITGIPRSWDRCFTSISTPFLAASSIIFKQTTKGILSSKSSRVSSRLLESTEASMMLITTSGFSLIRYRRARSSSISEVERE
jgi:hypothetical protein